MSKPATRSTYGKVLMRPPLSSPATRKLTLDGNKGNTCAAMSVTPDESPQSLTNEPAARSYSTAVHEHGAHADDELIANSHNFPHRPGGKSVQLAGAGRFETDRRSPARTDAPGPHPAISQGLPLRRRSRTGSRAAGYPGAAVAHPRAVCGSRQDRHHASCQYGTDRRIDPGRS